MESLCRSGRCASGVRWAGTNLDTPYFLRKNNLCTEVKQIKGETLDRRLVISADQQRTPTLVDRGADFPPDVLFLL